MHLKKGLQLPMQGERMRAPALQLHDEIASPELRQVLFDYLACQRVADAYRSEGPGLLTTSAAQGVRHVLI